MTALLVALALGGAPAERQDVCQAPACVQRVRARQRHRRARTSARRVVRAAVREERRLHRMRLVVAPHDAHLESIAACESGKRWGIDTGNGFYGGLQFTLSSWAAVGGRGFPNYASELEQKYRAVLLSRIQGWGAWPVCG